MDPKEIARNVPTNPWYPEVDALNDDEDEGELQWYIDLTEDRVGVFPVMEGEKIAFGEGKFSFPRGPYDSINDVVADLESCVNELNILENFTSAVGATVGATPESPPAPSPEGEEENPQLDDLSEMWKKIGKSLVDARTVAEQANVQSSNVASAAMVQMLITVIGKYNEFENPYNKAPHTGADRKIG